MRPPRVVCLVGDDEAETSQLSYLLYIHHYKVVRAEGPGAATRALLLLHAETWIDLLIMLWPLEGYGKLLGEFKQLHPHTPTLMIARDETFLGFDWRVDSALFKGQCSSAEILERVKVLTARKRGPALKGWVR